MKINLKSIFVGLILSAMGLYIAFLHQQLVIKDLALKEAEQQLSLFVEKETDKRAATLTQDDIKPVVNPMALLNSVSQSSTEIKSTQDNTLRDNVLLSYNDKSNAESKQNVEWNHQTAEIDLTILDDIVNKLRIQQSELDLVYEAEIGEKIYSDPKLSGIAMGLGCGNKLCAIEMYDVSKDEYLEIEKHLFSYYRYYFEQLDENAMMRYSDYSQKLKEFFTEKNGRIKEARFIIPTH